MRWIKSGRIVKANGEGTTMYESAPAGFRIESRKRAIPHANGVGYWLHTSYFLIREDGSEKEFWSLGEAKEAAEEEVG